MKVMISLLLLIFAAPALAETYRWVDERNTVNFSDDLGKIPEKYRKKAKVVGADELSAPEVIELDDLSKGKGKKAPAADAKDTNAADDKGKKKELIYGGKDGKTWKNEFARLKSEVQSEEKHLSELKDKLSDTSKMTRGEYVGLQNSVKYSESRIIDIQKKLDALNESADRAEVPADLR